MGLPKEVYDTMEKLDSVTYNHSWRVWELSLGAEQHCGLRSNVLSTAAFVHDIGKIYIPRKILDKRGGLTRLERNVIDLHPYYGYRILADAKVEELIKRIVLYHHGLYPKVLQPLPEYDVEQAAEYAKMLHTLDVFEALTTDRPYKRRMSAADSCELMEQEKGYHGEVLQYLKECAEDF